MENKPLPLAEMKKIVHDCFSPNPWIYWLDFLSTTIIAWICFFLTEAAAPLSAPELFYFTVSVFAFYRAALFIHELTHQDRRVLPGFSLTWNLLIGVPMLVPSFLYRGVHIDHHRKATYATNEDGEYLPFGASPIWQTILYFGQPILLPFLMTFRFGILTPLSFLHPRFRAFVMANCSAIAIRMDTARRLPTADEDLRNWHLLEALCFGWVLVLGILFSTGVLGLGTLRHVYLLLFATFLVNSVRTIVAHRYRNRSTRELSFAEQFQDSVNIEGHPLLLELVAPVGLRYHALHHLFPSMPYHNLGLAHRRLSSQLPADSIYHLATEPTLRSAYATHWRNSRTALREENELDAGSYHV